jgi:hypothetical protein
MMLGFVMMQVPRSEPHLSRTDKSSEVAAVPLAIVVLLTGLQVMLFTPHRASLELIARQAAIGLITP